MGRPFVSVVVLNYNGREHLEGCLASVLAQGYPAFEVLLVDNGSSDGSARFVRERFPAVHVLETGANLGFAEGNNRGVDAAKGDWIALLNNDTRVEAGWLEELVRAAADPEVAAVSSFVRTGGVPERYYERNGSISLAGYNVMRVFRRPEDLFYPTGCSCLFDRRRLGRPFDPDYFLYAEDVYLGLRVRFAGWQVRHVPGSRVVHEGSATTRRRPAAAMTFYQERNRLLNLLLFFDGWFLVRIAPYLAANAALKLALALVRGRPSPRGLLRAYGWLARNGAVVREKRRSLRAERRVPAREVVRWMSAKVVHGDGPAGRLLNAASVGYCRIAGIGTYEIRGGRG